MPTSRARTAVSRGFTLLEMLMTLALLASIASISALAGSDTYQRALAANDVERIAGVLRQARSFAQAGTCRVEPCDEPEAQGVRIAPREIERYEGTEFNGSGVFESIPLSEALLIDPAEIVFLPRSGNALREEVLRMTDAFGRVRMITISEAGVIVVDPP